VQQSLAKSMTNYA